MLYSSVINNPEASIQFINFLVKESHLSFKEPGKQKIAVTFSAKGYIFKEISQFHLQLEVTINEEEGKFEIHLETESIFEYPKNANLEFYKNSLFIVNAPAIVFPYLRAYITNLTALSGIPVLTIPTFNLSNLGESLKNNIVEA
ncbi:MAG: protein export chaperone secb [Sphingobacteriaceae bacterium]|nr:MAG: protein export chaperone secb [Sphingobacteriaceae bacterium]